MLLRRTEPAHRDSGTSVSKSSVRGGKTCGASPARGSAGALFTLTHARSALAEVLPADIVLGRRLVENEAGEVAKMLGGEGKAAAFGLAGKLRQVPGQSDFANLGGDPCRPVNRPTVPA